MKCYLVELSSDALALSPVKVALMQETINSNEQGRTWGVVSQIASILAINITTLKGLLEKMGGVRVVREIPVLRELRKLGVIGSKAPSIALYPMDQLKDALQNAKKVDMDLLHKLLTLTPPFDIPLGGREGEDEGEKEGEKEGDDDWEPDEDEVEGWEEELRKGGDWSYEEEEEEDGGEFVTLYVCLPACLPAYLSDVR